MRLFRLFLYAGIVAATVVCWELGRDSVIGTITDINNSQKVQQSSTLTTVKKYAVPEIKDIVTDSNDKGKDAKQVESDEVFLSLIGDDRLRNYVSTSFLLDEFKEGSVVVLDEIVDRITLRSLEESRKLLNNQIALMSSNISQNELSELVLRKSKLDLEINVFRNRLFRNEEEI